MFHGATSFVFLEVQAGWVFLSVLFQQACIQGHGQNSHNADAGEMRRMRRWMCSSRAVHKRRVDPAIIQQSGAGQVDCNRAG
jgi:hypothetical protein